jgi:hypothetical protein
MRQREKKEGKQQQKRMNYCPRGKRRNKENGESFER